MSMAKALRDCVMIGHNMWGWIGFRRVSRCLRRRRPIRPSSSSRAHRTTRLPSNSAHDGVVREKPPGRTAEGRLTYDRLIFGQRWLLATGADRDLIDRIVERCLRLDDPRVTRARLRRHSDKRRCDFPSTEGLPPDATNVLRKDAMRQPPYEVRIEDEIMKPLVSGKEAKRYVEPTN